MAESIAKIPCFSISVPLSNFRHTTQHYRKTLGRRSRNVTGSSHPRRSRVPIASAGGTQTRSLQELIADVEAATEEALAAVAATEDSAVVEKIRVSFLGKKGRITSVMKSVGKLPQENRPALGVAVNAAKNRVGDAIAERKELLEDLEIQRLDESEEIDVTLPGIRSRPMTGRIHPLLSTMDLALEIFTDIGYQIIVDPEYNREIETDFYCFEALNCPKDHPARDMQDTLYLKEDKSLLLRTQTSSVQVRYMEKNKPPFAIIAPGKVYRRDAIDATHSPMFHQIEILALEEGTRLNIGSLKATVDYFLRRMLGDNIKTRYRGSFFPFTEPSMEVDVFFKGRWLEVLGCGMVDPRVLEKVNIDPDKYQGFAAGFGVERFAMVMHEIDDIREFYKNDAQFITQFMHDS